LVWGLHAVLPRRAVLQLFENEATGDTYEFNLQTGENRLAFDQTPWPRTMNKGLERPLPLEAGKPYHVQVIADGSIATLYLDGVALNARAYAKKGQALSVYVIDGNLEVRNAGLRHPS
jgi:beta-fructofuranosidase